MDEVIAAPTCTVRVPFARKSHHEYVPPLEGCSAIQWPTGESFGGPLLWAEMQNTASSADGRRVRIGLQTDRRIELRIDPGRTKMFWFMSIRVESLLVPIFYLSIR